MKTYLMVLSVITFIILSACCGEHEKKIPLKKGAYLGQICPSENAAIFAPNFISTGMYERDLAISPDGNEIFYSLFMGDWNTIMVTRQIEGIWQEPIVAEFARDTNFFFAEPAFSADGKMLYYLSTKPRPSEQIKPGWNNQNIWCSQKQSDGKWGDGTPLPDNINGEEEFYPSLTNNGTLYFCRTNKTTGNSQILRSKLEDGVFTDPEILPAPVNAEGTHFNAYVSPDETYLVGCVGGRDPQNPRKATYMLFFHKADGSWSEGIDLIKELNLPCPNAISISVSPDGKYLFFASTQKIISYNTVSSNWNLSKLEERRNTPGNGNSDIYWLRFDSIVKRLKEQSR